MEKMIEALKAAEKFLDELFVEDVDYEEQMRVLALIKAALRETKMMLDAATTAKVIKHTISTRIQIEQEPARSILIAFEELVKSFEILQDKK